MEKNKKIPNIKQFQISFSKEEEINRVFSTCYGYNSFEFTGSILPAFNILFFNSAIIFKDKNLMQSLDKAKEEIDRIYISIKNPSEYSVESIMKRELYKGILFPEQNSLDNR